MAEAKQRNYSIDGVVTAIGGSGLISGVATYLKAKQPTTSMVGAEPPQAPLRCRRLLIIMVRPH